MKFLPVLLLLIFYMIWSQGRCATELEVFIVSAIVSTMSAGWGLFCLHKGYVWIRTKDPVLRKDTNEFYFLGVNSFFVFVGFFVFLVINKPSSPVFSGYLAWIFSKQGEIWFFVRLLPGYFFVTFLLAFLRPAR